MLGLTLDVIVLLFLIRATVGDKEEGIAKPAAIAIVAGMGILAAKGIAAAAPEHALWIMISATMVVGILFVAVGTMALFDVDIKKAAIVGLAFIVYKLVDILIVSSIFSS